MGRKRIGRNRTDEKKTDGEKNEKNVPKDVFVHVMVSLIVTFFIFYITYSLRPDRGTGGQERSIAHGHSGEYIALKLENVIKLILSKIGNIAIWCAERFIDYYSKHPEIERGLKSGFRWTLNATKEVFMSSVSSPDCFLAHH